MEVRVLSGVLSRGSGVTYCMDCSGVIPGTLVVCGEYGNYCSEACQAKAGVPSLNTLARHPHDVFVEPRRFWALLKLTYSSPYSRSQYVIAQWDGPLSKWVATDDIRHNIDSDPKLIKWYIPLPE